MDAGCQCRHKWRILIEILGLWIRIAAINFTLYLTYALTAVLAILLA
jgi:hypothetical protein